MDALPDLSLPSEVCKSEVTSTANSSVAFSADFVEYDNATSVYHGSDSSFDNDNDNNTSMASLVLRLSVTYQQYHGYVSILICTFGIASNVANIIVLTRPRMRKSPTNFLLTSLAVADAITMTSYLPYVIYFYCLSTPEVTSAHARTSVVFLIVSISLSITTHTAAIWLTVTVALFRYLAVYRKRNDLAITGHVANFRRMRQVRLSALAVLLATVLLCSPNYVLYKPVKLQAVRRNGTTPYQQYCIDNSQTTDGATVGYWFIYNEFITHNYKTINFWLYGVFLKICPCVILSILSVLLVCVVRKAERRHRLVKQQSRSIASSSSSSPEHIRTTVMLVAVALCFVTAELPQGILAFCSGLDHSLFRHFYVPLGDLFDILALVNSAVNFLLYCTMSRNFRSTFVDVFRRGSTAAAADRRMRGRRNTFSGRTGDEDMIPTDSRYHQLAAISTVTCSFRPCNLPIASVVTQS